MSNERTTSLHRILSVDERRAVERDLAERPPGQETLQKCYEHHQLQQRGISFSSLARYGRHIRMTARRQWVGTLIEKPDEGIGRHNVLMARERIFESLADDEITASDLMRLSIVEKNLTKSAISDEQWIEKQRQVAKALQDAQAEGEHDPQKALADVLDNIRTIYGLGRVEA